MHKLDFVLENETYKLLRDFEIQTDHLIPARRTSMVTVNNNNNIKKGEFAEQWTLPFRVKLKESEKKCKYQNLARELKKHESDGDTH